jgi:hypothetical protein
MITNSDLTADEKQNRTLAFILLNISGAAYYCPMCIVTGAREAYGGKKRRCAIAQENEISPAS